MCNPVYDHVRMPTLDTTEQAPHSRRSSRLGRGSSRFAITCEGRVKTLVQSEHPGLPHPIDHAWCMWHGLIGPKFIRSNKFSAKPTAILLL